MAATDPTQTDGSAAGKPTQNPLSIEQFIAFNDELAALVRAGLPLERSLSELARDNSGRLRSIMEIVAERLSRGESLAAAVAAESGRLPSFYRAVVEAGIQAGQLPIALEGVGNYARNYADMRRTVGMALVYPLIVVVIAYTLFLFFVTELAPRFLATFRLFRLPSEAILGWLPALGGTVLFWGPVLPILLIPLLIWWLRTGPRAWRQPMWVQNALARVPWVRAILTNTQTASFAELMVVLVDNHVPLHDAVVLAADASGDERVRRGAQEMAQAMVRGETPAVAAGGAKFFPPLLRWLLVTGFERGGWVQAMRHASDTYRELAQYQASLLKQLLPVVLLLAIGATAVFVYGLTIFVPFSLLLRDLAA